MVSSVKTQPARWLYSAASGLLRGRTSDPWFIDNKLCGRPPQYAPVPYKLTFDLLTLKVVSESPVMWATSVPILVFLGLSVLDLGQMYATDRQTFDVRRQTRIIA